MNTHDEIIDKFIGKITVFLFCKYALLLLTVWGFAWGTVVLVLRAAIGVRSEPLAWGWLAVVPIAIIAFAWAKRQILSTTQVRALLDRESRFGGLLMAAEEMAIGEWQQRLQPVAVPQVHWYGGRSCVYCVAAGIFLVVSFLVPQRFVVISSENPLEIGKEVAKLADKIELLQEQEIIESEKASHLQEKLQQIHAQARGEDPVTTWEALDHLNKMSDDAAKKAAETAVRETERLTQMETLAKALQKHASAMTSQTAKKSMQELTDMVRRAAKESKKLKKRLRKKKTLGACKSGALSSKELKTLMRGLQGRKTELDHIMRKLAQSGMIDPKTFKLQGDLSQKCNSQGLAKFIQQNQGTMSVPQMTAKWCRGPGKSGKKGKLPGRGGISRGRADAPMIWSNGTSEKGAKFKEQTLPPGAISAIKDSKLIDISMGAPVVGDPVDAEHGAIKKAQSGGGSTNTHRILPRHRGVIKRYFERQQ